MRQVRFVNISQRSEFSADTWKCWTQCWVTLRV